MIFYPFIDKTIMLLFSTLYSHLPKYVEVHIFITVTYQQQQTLVILCVASLLSEPDRAVTEAGMLPVPLSVEACVQVKNVRLV